MRADPNLYANVGSSIQSSELSLQTAVNQLSSGKRVALPSDDPLAFAQNLQSLAASANVDRYTKNGNAALLQAQQADSTLSSVITSLTQAISIGTEGGNSDLTSSQRAVFAQQVQAIVGNVVSLANTTSNGVALFGGTSGTTTAFVADAMSPTGYTYQGDSNSNQTQVGDTLSVPVTLPGDSIFTNASGNVLGSLQQVITALQSGSTSALATANAAVTAAIAQVGQVRASYGSTENELTNQNNYLSQETLTLTSQQTSLVDVDTATAATNLTQAQTANSTILAVAAKILPQSILNYLH